MSIQEYISNNFASRRRILAANRALLMIPGKNDLTITHKIQRDIENIAATYEKEIVYFTDFIIHLVKIQMCNKAPVHLEAEIQRCHFFTYEHLASLRENLLKRDPMLVLSEVPSIFQTKTFAENSHILKTVKRIPIS